MLSNILKYVIFFPGLVLHESMHAIVAILFGGKITSIRLFPKIEKNMFIYGYVNFGYKTNITPLMASIAPLLLLLLSIMFMRFTNILNFDLNNIYSSFAVVSFFPNQTFIVNIFIYYCIAQMIWGSFLSSVDIKLFFNSLFKIDSLIFIAIIVFILKKYFQI